MKGKDTGNAGVLFCLIENNLKKIIKKVFYFKISITFDLSKALKQSNKPYQNVNLRIRNLEKRFNLVN